MTGALFKTKRVKDILERRCASEPLKGQPDYSDYAIVRRADLLEFVRLVEDDDVWLGPEDAQLIFK